MKAYSNNSNIKTFTAERIANNKFTLLVSTIASFAINLLLIILLAADGISFGYVLFPMLLCVLDAVFLAASLFTNFKFAYSTLYVAVFTAAFALISVIFTVVLLDLISSERAVAITYVSFALWAAVSVVTVAAVVLGVLRAGKESNAIAAILSMLTLLACIGGYVYHTVDKGFFGQGGDEACRPITFVFDEENGHYVAKSLVKARGSTVVIPSTFNGVKVGAVDCSLLADKSIDLVNFASSDIRFENITALASVSDTLKVSAGKADIANIALQLYDQATDNSESISSILSFVDKLAPNDLAENEVCILFHYDESSYLNANGKYIPLWVGNTGDIFKLDHAADIDYVLHSDASDEALLATLYNSDANGGGYIMSALSNGRGEVLHGSRITDRITHVNVGFDKIYRIRVRADNDEKYELSDSFRYLDTAQSSLAYRFATVHTSATLLNAADQRNGFSLSWNYSYPNESSSTPLSSLPQLLASSAQSSVSLHPVWTLNAPSIIACKTQSGLTSFTYGDDLTLQGAATAPTDAFSLRYRWSYKGSTVATTESFDISKIKMLQAGQYDLTVTAYADEITSLTSSASESLDIQVQRKLLPITWLGMDGTDLFRRVYTAESSAPMITYDESALVYAEDAVSYTFNTDTLLNAGSYNVEVSLTGDCSSKYYVAADRKAREYVIDKKVVDLSWNTENLIYKKEKIAPTVAIVSGICLNDDLTVSAGGQINTGSYKTEAVLDGAHKNNYTVNEAHRFCNYTILPATLTVTWEQTSQTYTSQNLTPVATPIGLQGTDVIKDLGFTLTCKNAKNVGEYTASVAITNTNYVIAAEDKEHRFEITRAPLTLTYSNTEQIYSASDLSPSFTVSGRCSGDTESGLQIRLSTAKDVGIYTITATVGNGNYTILNPTLTNFTIKQKPVTVIWSNQTELTYNGEAQHPAINNQSGVFAQDLAQVSVSVDVAASSNIFVATSQYTAYAVLNDATGNYCLDEASATCRYKIVPKTLELRWSNIAFVYDGTSHLPEAEILSGVVLGDTVNLTVNGSQTNAVTNATATATIDNTNYRLKNPTQGFTVAKKTVTLIWSDLLFDYDGTLHKPTAQPTAADVIGADVISVTVSGQKNAGTHTASATTTNKNYSFTNPTQEFTVRQRTLTVVWSDLNPIYNASVQAPTATVSDNVISGDTVQIRVNGGQMNAGTDYTATAVSQNANYTLENSTVLFSIAPRTISAVFSNTTVTYNGSYQKPTVSFNGAAGNDQPSASILVNASAEGAKSVGEYTATVVLTDPNYTLDTTTASTAFIIVAKEVRVLWNGETSFIYDGTAKAPTANADALTLVYTYERYNSATESYSSIASKPTEIGSYRVSVSTDSNNHTLTNQTCEFTIQAASIAD